MRVLARLSAGALCLTAGCAAPASEAIAPLGGPFLTDQPRWTATAPTNDTCFGASVALGDLDGDGRVDLAVAEPPCLTQPATPGRVAIYRGRAAGDFATAPAWTTLDWQNPPRGGHRMVLSTGDVDADGRDDLLVSSQAGVHVFTGIANAGAPLPAPAFRAPGTGTFSGGLLADVDGDGRADLVYAKSGVRIARSVPGPQVFAETRVIPGALGRAADTDGDGRADLIATTTAGESQLYLGCPIGAPDCDGGVGAAPVWSEPRRVLGVIADQDGDGRAEALLGDELFGAFGRIGLHLSDAAGGWAEAAAAGTLGDPNYPAFGQNATPAGDLDGDGDATEFLIGSAGRIYGFFPGARPALRPRAAWPRDNEAQAQRLHGGAIFTTGNTSIAAGRDLNGDGRADLVVGNAREIDTLAFGHVHVFSGGRPRPLAPLQQRPYLMGERTCGAGPSALPDLTVDRAALARSLYVEERAFAAGSCELAEGCVAGPGTRRLLRFTTSIANLGGGPLVIPGPESAPHLYHFDACHGHDHLSDFARYELRDRHGDVLAVGRKQGFFLVDIAPYCADGPGGTDYYPDQGISPGWSDVYVSSIPCQWLDVTDVPDGRYTLRIEVDSLGIVEQDDVLPDTVSVRVRLADDRVYVLD